MDLVLQSLVASMTLRCAYISTVMTIVYFILSIISDFFVFKN